jgi:hypothetical protein
MGYYPHFILPMRRSRGFASAAANLFALFRLAFASAPCQRHLTLLTTASRRIIMQKARDHPAVAGIGLSPLVGMWFQVHYPPLVGVLPIVRSRYWYAIGRQGVLSLAGWAPQIRTGFHVSRLTQVPDRPLSPFAYGTVTRCGPPFQAVRLRYCGPKHRSYNPPGASPRGLGWSAFARRY